MTTVTLLADQAIDTEKMILDGIDTSDGPLYSVSEMASFFFARSPYWVRWLESCHYVGPDKKTCSVAPVAHSKRMREQHKHMWRFMLDDELLVPIRSKSNARKYDLALVEKIAHALASNGTIDATQLRRALLLIKIQYEMHEPRGGWPKVEQPAKPAPKKRTTKTAETPVPVEA